MSVTDLRAPPLRHRSRPASSGSIAYSVAYGQFVAVPGRNEPVFRVASQAQATVQGNVSFIRQAIRDIRGWVPSLFGLMASASNFRRFATSTPASDDTLEQFNGMLREARVSAVFKAAIEGDPTLVLATRSAQTLQKLLRQLDESAQGLFLRAPRLATLFDLLKSMHGKVKPEDIARHQDLIKDLSQSFSSLRPVLDYFEDRKAGLDKAEKRDATRAGINELFIPTLVKFLNAKEVDLEGMLTELHSNLSGYIKDVPELTEVFNYTVNLLNNPRSAVSLTTELLDKVGDLIDDKQVILQGVDRAAKVARLRDVIERRGFTGILVSLLHGNLMTSVEFKQRVREWKQQAEFGGKEEEEEDVVGVVSRFVRLVSAIADNSDKIHNPREIAVMLVESNLREVLGSGVYSAAEYALRHAVVFANAAVWLRSGSLYDVLIGNLSNIESIVIPPRTGDLVGIVKYLANQEHGPIDFLASALLGTIPDRASLENKCYEWVAALSPGDPTLANYPGLGSLLRVLVKIQHGANVGECVYEQLETLLDITEGDKLKAALSKYMQKKRILGVIEHTLVEPGGTIDFFKRVISESIDEAHIAIEGNRILADFAQRLHNATSANIDQLCTDVSALWHLLTFFGGLNELSTDHVVERIDKLIPKLSSFIDTSHQLGSMIVDYRIRRAQTGVIEMLNVTSGPVDFIIQCIDEWPDSDTELIKSTSRKWYELLTTRANSLHIPGADEIIDLMFGMADGINRDDVVCYVQDILEEIRPVCRRTKELEGAISNYQHGARRRALLELVWSVLNDQEGAVEFLISVADERLTSMEVVKIQSIEFFRLLSSSRELDELEGLVNLFWSIGVGELTQTREIVHCLHRVLPSLQPVLNNTSLESSISSFIHREELCKVVVMLVNNKNGCADVLCSVLQEEEQDCDVHGATLALSRNLTALTEYSVSVARTVVPGMDALMNVLSDLQTGGYATDPDAARSLILCMQYELSQIITTPCFFEQLERSQLVQDCYYDAYQQAKCVNLSEFFINTFKDPQIDPEALAVQSHQLSDALSTFPEFYSLSRCLVAQVAIPDLLVQAQALSWLPKFRSIQIAMEKFTYWQGVKTKVFEVINGRDGPAEFLFDVLSGTVEEEKEWIQVRAKHWQINTTQKLAALGKDSAYVPGVAELLELFDAISTGGAPRYDTINTLNSVLDPNKLSKVLAGRKTQTIFSGLVDEITTLIESVK